jgi:hypothetical protein
MVTNRPLEGRIGSGRHAPARFVSAVALVIMVPAAALGQARPAPQQPARTAPAQAPAPAVTPVPDQMTLLKLLWSTMSAIDHANKTGNYSVLRDLGSPGFQANNNAATLGTIFATIRQQQVDLSDTLIVQPVFEFAPQIVQPGVLRMRGIFNLRPQAIQFDLLYQWRNGWMLDGVAVRAVAMTSPAVRR